MDIPPLLEAALLGLINAMGSPSWRQIASHLSAIRVPREIDMMEALKALHARGFLEREVEEGSSTDRWKLTPEGLKRAMDIALSERHG